MDGVFASDDARPRRDVAWSFAFVATTIAAVAIGIASATSTVSSSASWRALRQGTACLTGSEDAWRATLDANRARIEASTTTRPVSAALGVGSGKGYGRRSTVMLGGVGSVGDDDGTGGTDAEAVFAAAWPWVLVALAASVTLGFALVHALRKHSRTVVWGVMYAKVAIMGAVTLLSLTWGLMGPTLLLAFFTALAALVCYLWRDELNLIASMIAVSTQSITDNPHLLTMTMLLQLTVLLYLFPVAWLAIKASQHGSAVINKYAVDKTTDACLGYYTQAVDCCSWQVENWVPAYYALATFAAIWAIATALEFRMFVIGGSVTQWYFSPAGTKDFKGTTMTSVKHALGPSFGTICYGSFVIAVVEMLKRMAEKSRRENRGNLLVYCVVCCLQCLYAFIEYISRFAMLQASMTGEAFCDAAKTVSDLLSRNFLLAYGTYAFPQYVLSFVVFVMALALGLTSYYLVYFAYDVTSDAFTADTYALVVGGISFVIAYIVLGFFIMVLLNVIDAVFVCYAVDKDRNAVHHADLHEVFDKVNERQKRANEAQDGDQEYGEPLNARGTKYASM